MIRFYALALLLLGSFTSLAQGVPGYVITSKGDSLVGIVAEKGSDAVLFYPKGGGPAQTMRAAQVKGYGLAGQILIRSQRVQLASGVDSARFVLPLQLGKASLYSFADESGLLLLPPNANTLYELTATNWRVLFNQYLHDCPTLDYSSWDIANTSFTEPHIRRMVSRYGQCVDPNWKSSAPVTRGGQWRQGVGVRASIFRIRATDQVSPGNIYSGGVEWTAVRASGMQVSLVGAYSHFPQQTSFFSSFNANGIATDAQYITRQSTLSTALSFGHRAGRPQHLNLVLGGGIGLHYQLQASTQYRERLAGTNNPYQTTGTQYYSGELAPYLEVNAGVLRPLGNRHEVRFLATYQFYALGEVGLWGAQVAYVLFRK